MSNQDALFTPKELPLKLKKLTDDQIQRLADKHFGNAESYYSEEIYKFARAIEKKIQGKNK